MSITIPSSVPKKMESVYKKNFKEATLNTNKLFLFAGDQKIEHLNEDFADSLGFGNSDPEHLFQIASSSKIGVFAAHLGLVSRYGKKYKKIPYLIKLNGKSNIVKSKDPLSKALWSVNDVIDFKKTSGLKILGVGYTLYLGSEYENEMMKEAAEITLAAHKNGLLSVLWIYPRGKNVKNEKSMELLSGAAGVGLCLGADFIKLNYPLGSSAKEAKKFKEVVIAGGNSGIICSGGKKIEKKDFIKTIKNQINIAGARGCAIGRNMHQNKIEDAVKLAEKINKELVK
jgi:fructose-bisphosphate aldolase / 6-deoxy-5-ketofructose 1-phosphate synthase